MNIIKERTRIIFSEYTSLERKRIEDLVATMDKVFIHEDPDAQKLFLPPGMIGSVKKIFPKVPVEDRSKQHWPFANIAHHTHEVTPRNQLQVDAISFALKNAQSGNGKTGLILSPGSGKTAIACYLALKLKVRTLIVVPTTNIKNQWGETLTGMFGVPEDRVLIVNSPREFFNVKADFVVVSQASLASINKNYDLEKIMEINKFGLKVIDEVQMWFHNIIRVDGSSNICHNIYLTGTFGRSSDEENNIYQEMFGEIAIFREKEKKPTFWDLKPGNVYGMKPHMNVNMIWANSELTDEQIKSVTKSMRYSEREGRWMRFGISIPAYTKLIIPDDGTMTPFLRVILQTVKDAQKQVDYGKTLVLSPTVVSVEILAHYLKQMFPNLSVGTIHSKKPKAESDRVKEECDIMISTVKSAGTGFDVKGLSRLVICEQFKSWILTMQVLGRLRRRDDGRDTYAWDIVDSDIPQLVAWANVRAAVAKRISKKFKVVDF